MDVKEKKPEVRFGGFTDAWEQCKLGEVCESLEYGLNAAAKEFDGENKYIRITDIDDGSRLFLETNLTSPNIDLVNAENYELKNGDILFARTGASVGKSYIYKDSDGLVYYAGFLIRARVKSGYDAEYVFQNTLRNDYNKYIRVTSQRSGQPGVNAKEYGEFSIRVPKYGEQTKISTYLRQFDNLITLHQRKYDKLVIVKKSMLEKMFPKEGANTPEIRFGGFTDAWEQCKLTDEVELFSGLTYSPSDIVKGNGTFVLRSSNVKNGEVIDADNVYVNPDVVNSSNVKNGDIIVVVRNGSRSLIGKHAQIKGDMDFTVIGAFMTGLRSDHSNFINALLDTPMFKAEIDKNLGATINQITNGMFHQMQFMIPKPEEQDRIGEIFTGLDNLITLHKRELEKLKNIKKSMLEKMFV